MEVTQVCGQDEVEESPLDGTQPIDDGEEVVIQEVLRSTPT